MPPPKPKEDSLVMVNLCSVRFAPGLTSNTCALPPPLMAMFPPPSIVSAPAPLAMGGNKATSVIVPLTLKEMTSSAALLGPQSPLPALFADAMASRRVQNPSLAVGERESARLFTTKPAAQILLQYTSGTFFPAIR